MGKPVSRSDSKSKAERKFQKKVQFYERVGETVTALNAQKTIKLKKSEVEKKQLKAFDLTTLSEFLPGLETPKQKSSAAELKVNCKSRLKFILKERKQMGTVLNHPAFQADPLKAIHLHLESTQPVEEPKKKKYEQKWEQEEEREKVESFCRTSTNVCWPFLVLVLIN